MLEPLFVVEIFAFLSWLFGYVRERLDKKVIANFETYNVTNCTTNNDNTHIVQYLKEEI